MKRLTTALVTLALLLGCMAVAADTSPQKVGNYYFKFERIGEPYRYQLLYSADGKNFQNAPLPLFESEYGFPVYGNGRYLLVNSYLTPSGIPSTYHAEENTGPLYVMDDEFRLIETVNLGGAVHEYAFQDGQFTLHMFYKEDTYTSRRAYHAFCGLTYRSADGVNWTLHKFDGAPNNITLDANPYIELVEKPQALYVDEIKTAARRWPIKLGDYYFIDRTYSKDAITYTTVDVGPYYPWQLTNFFTEDSYGNGRYIGINTGHHTTYVYDANMNLIGSTHWEGSIDTDNLVFYKGMFYMSYYPNAYYCSADGLTWQPTTQDEYERAYNTQVLPNGSELLRIEQNGTKSEWLDGIPVTRESDYPQTANPNLYDYLHPGDFSEIDHPDYKFIVRDGLKKVYLPMDANLQTGVRTDDTYLYVRRDVFDSQCYRIPLSAFESDVKIICNGKYLAFNVAPVVEQGATLVPLRFLAEQMGATVTWDEATQSATVELSGNTVVLLVGQKVALANCAPQALSVAPRLIQDKTMVPLRFLAEHLGCSVTWDEASKTATVSN